MGLNYLVIGFSICIQAAFLILCRPHTKTQPRVFRGGVSRTLIACVGRPSTGPRAETAMAASPFPGRPASTDGGPWPADFHRRALGRPAAPTPGR